MSFLVISEILGRFVNAFTADDQHSRRNSENLPQAIHMQLSLNQKPFSEFFALFFKSISNSEHFLKKIGTSSLKYFPNYGLRTSDQFQNIVRKWKFQRFPNTAEIYATPLLSYFCISLGEMKLENVSLSDISNFRLFVGTLTADSKYSLLNRKNLL